MSELDKHITLEDFERLYSEYKPRFIIIARSYIRNNMAAEDIVTDSFLYFWENKDKLNMGQAEITVHLLKLKILKC